MARSWALVALGVLAGACTPAGPGATSSTSLVPTTTGPDAVAPAGARYVPPAPTTAGGCHARGALPDPACTPGATDPAVTAANLATTVCRPGGGYSASVRPQLAVTEPIKRERMRGYAIDARLASVELDHLVPLSIGGAAGGAGHGGVANLWPVLWGRPAPRLWGRPAPEPWDGAQGARVKDRLELRLLALVCGHQLDLATAQEAIASDWVSAYKRYVG